jgi:hypothetical protein
LLQGTPAPFPTSKIRVVLILKSKKRERDKQQEENVSRPVWIQHMSTRVSFQQIKYLIQLGDKELGSQVPLKILLFLHWNHFIRKPSHEQIKSYRIVVFGL